MNITPMTLTELVSACTDHLLACDQNSDFQSYNVKADTYYYGRLRGDEDEGYSKAVSRDVQEVVDAMIPEIINMFSSNDVVQAVGRREDADEKAKQVTDWLRYNFFDKNDGKGILYTLLFNGLLHRVGAVKVYRQEKVCREREEFKAITREEFDALVHEHDPRVVEFTEYPDPDYVPPPPPVMPPVVAPDGTLIQMPPPPPPPHPMLIDCRLEYIESDSTNVIANIAPENFRVENGASSIDEAYFLADSQLMQAGELIKYGVEPEQIAKIPSAERATVDAQVNSRFNNENGSAYVSPAKGMARKVWVTDCYIKIDFDGDGMPEWNRVVIGGDASSNIVLLHEEVEGHPYEIFSPFKVPHRWYGDGIKDKLEDIQDVKTALLRGLLNTIYLGNQPRVGVVEGKVNLDDLLNSRVGGIVRMTDPNAIIPINTTNAAPMAAQAIDYLDSVREQRVGVTRYNQGLDAESLNKTASGIAMIKAAGNKRVGFVASVAAETMRGIFKRMLQLSIKFSDKEELIKLRGSYVRMNPAEWEDSYDVTINIGTEIKTQDQMMATAMNIMAVQEKLLQAPAVQISGMVQPANIYNALDDLVRATGTANTSHYFTDPANIPPPPPPQPDPAVEINKDTLLSAQAIESIKLERERVNLEQHKVKLHTEQIKARIDVSKYGGVI